MNWDRVGAIVRKDIGEITASRMVLIPMVVVPLLLSIAVPGAIAGAALGLGEVLVTGVQYVEKLIPRYHVPPGFVTPTEQVLYVFLTYTFLPFLMLVPLMASSIIAANAIVGEKERHTLETLLYTPVTNREFLTAKLLASLVPAVLISWMAFAGYFAVLNLIYALVRGGLVVRSWIWLPAVLLLSPAVSLLGLAVTLLVSLKAKTYTEAQQVAGVVVVPIVALIVVQIAGVIIFNPLFVVLLAIVLGATGVLITLRVAPRFSREGIIATL